MATDDAWWTLDALNTEVPDHHHDSTVENLVTIFGASDHLACLRKEDVPVDQIQKWQLLDDPDAVESIAKVEDIRRTLRSGRALPAIVLVHTPDGPRFGDGLPRRIGAYHLLEGMHRYNATYLEQAPTIFAWVAHVGCCGGPEADAPEEMFDAIPPSR
ncbi:hypothetical protein [Actinoplanes rectilineatus]|uniref:hypothetical protein n=1 Tax=Actinoplanes rectilineatus TaxID=113571 RepID=UPI0005F2BE64|nr:hypothetical protein [Actinoplanes rectilineatus]